MARTWHSAWGLPALAAALAAGTPASARAEEVADARVTNAVPVLGVARGITPRTDGIFESVAATVFDRRLRVVWAPSEPASTNATVVVHTSTGLPGHWSSRDWRAWPMTRQDAVWQATVPIASVEAPVAYQVLSTLDGATQASGVRLFRPDVAGVALPTFPFTGYLEGFEEGAGGWEPTVAAGGDRGMNVSTNALSGRVALRIEVPGGRGSMTVGTTRVQGWMLVEHAPLALRFAARTETGSGRVGCALHGHAQTPDLAVYPAAGTFDVGPTWQRLEVPLEAFTGLRPATVDWFTIQFFAEPARALLVDDVELVLR